MGEVIRCSSLLPNTNLSENTAQQQQIRRNRYSSTMPVRGNDILLILVAILFPPASVFFITGCSCDLLINILLTALGYLPGHIHAFYLIYKKMEAESLYGPSNYVSLGNGHFEPARGVVYEEQGPQR